MTMKKILVIGSGLIGCRHARIIQQHPLVDLVGVVDIDPARHTENDLRYYCTLEEVHEDVDAAIIAVPNHLHATLSIQAIARGWHVLIEKPVTAKPEEVDAIEHAAHKAHMHCLVGHHRRYHPRLQILKDIVTGGRIGQPVTTTNIWCVRKPDAYFAANWRTDQGSPIMINMIHDIDMLKFVMGDIVDITGLGAQCIRQTKRVETGAVAMRFASGACGAISFTDTAPSPWSFEAGIGENPNIATTHQDMWWITGTQGGVSFPSLTLWGGAADWSEAAQKTVVPAGSVIPLQVQLEHFLAVIAGRELPMVSLQDAKETLRLSCMLEDIIQQSMA